ncbi:hypothetical protein KEJ15_08600 [Candidatus Bathyarchaeota archaeon]|nr:hypothetical protein [Candidatus Bathyarchaeota archaeon]
MRLVQIIASSSRQRILLALSKTKQTHISNLVRMANSTYSQVNRNLQILENEGIVKIRHYGRVKMVELDTANPRTRVLLQALTILDRPLREQELYYRSQFDRQLR